MTGALYPMPFHKGETVAEVPFIKVSEVISWFIRIDFKQIYCSYSRTPKLRNDFP